MPKRTTKTQRMQRIIREYTRRHPGPFVINDVVEWALGQRLLPAPGRTKAEVAAAAAWDRRFEQIAAEEV